MKTTLRVLFIFLGASLFFSPSCTFFVALGTPIPATETNTPAPSPTRTLQATPFPSLTSTATQVTSPPSPFILPTATIPLVIINTYTPTPIPSSVTVTIESTNIGDFLNVSRFTDNKKSRFGPIASGKYVIGPNDNYLIYCTFDGKVYAARLGDAYLTPIGDVKKFTAMVRNVPPNLELVIFFNNGRYKVNIREHNFNQNEILVVPGWISN